MARQNSKYFSGVINKLKAYKKKENIVIDSKFKAELKTDIMAKIAEMTAAQSPGILESIRSWGYTVGLVPVALLLIIVLSQTMNVPVEISNVEITKEIPIVATEVEEVAEAVVPEEVIEQVEEAEAIIEEAEVETEAPKAEKADELPPQKIYDLPESDVSEVKPYVVVTTKAVYVAPYIAPKAIEVVEPVAVVEYVPFVPYVDYAPVIDVYVPIAAPIDYSEPAPIVRRTTRKRDRFDDEPFETFEGSGSYDADDNFDDEPFETFEGSYVDDSTSSSSGNLELRSSDDEEQNDGGALEIRDSVEELDPTHVSDDCPGCMRIRESEYESDPTGILAYPEN